MADQHEVDLDSIIDRLLEVRGSRPGKQVQLLEAEIRYLCTKAREIFISQPILLELEAPIKVRATCCKGADYPCRRVLTCLNLCRSVVTFTANIMTFSACSNMAASLLKPTICFWGITSTEASSLSRPFACF